MHNLKSLFPRLNPMALARLDEGIDLFMECESNSDNFPGPRWLQMKVNAQVMSSIGDAQEHCTRKQWRLIEVPQAPQYYDELGSKAQVTSWTLQVDSSDFWFYGNTNGDYTVQSHYIQQDKLIEALNSPIKNGETFGGTVKWHGNALVFTNWDLDEFCEILSDCLPQMKAQKRAQEMAETLKIHCTNSPEDRPAPARRMRL